MGDMGDITGNIGTRNRVYRGGHMWEMGTLCNRYEPARGILSLLDIFLRFSYICHGIRWRYDSEKRKLMVRKEFLIV